MSRRYAYNVIEAAETVSAIAHIDPELPPIRTESQARALANERYCEDRWEMSRPRAYQLIEAARTVSTIVDTDSSAPIPTTETQARALAPLRREPEKMAEALREADKATGGGLSRPYAYQLIEASRVAEEVSAIADTPPIRTESQARALLPVGRRREGTCPPCRLNLHRSPFTIWSHGGPLPIAGLEEARPGAGGGTMLNGPAVPRSLILRRRRSGQQGAIFPANNHDR